MKHFLDLMELADGEIQELLQLSRELQRRPRPRALGGRVVGLFFLNPSLRTKASCESAMARLGGGSFVVTPGQGSWKLETRLGAVMDGEAQEHLREAILVLEEYGDALGVRSFAEGRDLARDLQDPLIQEVARLASKPVVNLESAACHPCQALADWKTLDDEGVPSDGRFVLSWASHPRPLPLAVPISTLLMAAQRGMQVTVLRPPGFGLPKGVMARARSLAAGAGGSLCETASREEALAGAHVLYAKSWQAPDVYGDLEAEARLRLAAGPWTVGEDWFAPARPEAIFMHCLPVRRNVVVSDEVLDGPRSRVIPEAGNRLYTQMALFLKLLGANP